MNSFSEGLSIKPTLQYFDGDALLKLPVCPLGEIHQTHATASNDGDHLIGAQPLTGRETESLYDGTCLG